MRTSLSFSLSSVTTTETVSPLASSSASSTSCERSMLGYEFATRATSACEQEHDIDLYLSVYLSTVSIYGASGRCWGTSLPRARRRPGNRKSNFTIYRYRSISYLYISIYLYISMFIYRERSMLGYEFATRATSAWEQGHCIGLTPNP